MQVAKDSGKANKLPDAGIPQSNEFGPDINSAKSIDVSAGYSAGSDYTVA